MPKSGTTRSVELSEDYYWRHYHHDDLLDQCVHSGERRRWYTGSPELPLPPFDYVRLEAEVWNTKIETSANNQRDMFADKKNYSTSTPIQSRTASVNSFDGTTMLQQGRFTQRRVTPDSLRGSNQMHGALRSFQPSYRPALSQPHPIQTRPSSIPSQTPHYRVFKSPYHFRTPVNDSCKAPVNAYAQHRGNLSGSFAIKSPSKLKPTSLNRSRSNTSLSSFQQFNNHDQLTLSLDFSSTQKGVHPFAKYTTSSLPISQPKANFPTYSAFKPTTLTSSRPAVYVPASSASRPVPPPVLPSSNNIESTSKTALYPLVSPVSHSVLPMPTKVSSTLSSDPPKSSSNTRSPSPTQSTVSVDSSKLSLFGFGGMRVPTLKENTQDAVITTSKNAFPKTQHPHNESPFDKYRENAQRFINERKAAKKAELEQGKMMQAERAREVEARKAAKCAEVYHEYIKKTDEFTKKHKEFVEAECCKARLQCEKKVAQNCEERRDDAKVVAERQKTMNEAKLTVDHQKIEKDAKFGKERQNHFDDPDHVAKLIKVKAEEARRAAKHQSVLSSTKIAAKLEEKRAVKKREEGDVMLDDKKFQEAEMRQQQLLKTEKDKKNVENLHQECFNNSSNNIGHAKNKHCVSASLCDTVDVMDYASNQQLSNTSSYYFGDSSDSEMESFFHSTAKSSINNTVAFTKTKMLPFDNVLSSSTFLTNQSESDINVDFDTVKCALKSGLISNGVSDTGKVLSVEPVVGNDCGKSLAVENTDVMIEDVRQKLAETSTVYHQTAKKRAKNSRLHDSEYGVSGLVEKPTNLIQSNSSVDVDNVPKKVCQRIEQMPNSETYNKKTNLQQRTETTCQRVSNVQNSNTSHYCSSLTPPIAEDLRSINGTSSPVTFFVVRSSLQDYETRAPQECMEKLSTYRLIVARELLSNPGFADTLKKVLPLDVVFGHYYLVVNASGILSRGQVYDYEPATKKYCIFHNDENVFGAVLIDALRQMPSEIAVALGKPLVVIQSFKICTCDTCMSMASQPL